MAEPITGTAESGLPSNGSGSVDAEQASPSPGSTSQTKQLMIGLLIALVLVSIMATTYISAEHLPVAHNLPWGVTGPSTLTTAVQEGTDLQIHQYASQADLEQAINQGTIYGGFVSQTNTVIVAQAASLKASLDLPVAYEKAARAQGLQIQVMTVNKLPPQDPEGVVPIVSVFVLLLAGYLGATMAMQRTKTAARRWRVGVLLGYAVIAGLAIDLIAGPLLGGYPDIGTNFWILWPEFVFICFATALLAATLQSMIGPIGTLITLVVVVFLGNPSTGGANGVAYLPPFWQSLGALLPPRNGLVLIRNTLYFNGNGITTACIILGIYVIVGFALVTIFSLMRWQAEKAAGLNPDAPVVDSIEETAVAAIPPG
ncbi:MAG: hypothetical protein ACLPR9_06410 [Acidimicrobiales bacterium]